MKNKWSQIARFFFDDISSTGFQLGNLIGLCLFRRCSPGLLRTCLIGDVFCLRLTERAINLPKKKRENFVSSSLA